MKYNLKKYSIRLFIKVFLIFLQLFVIVADLSAAPYKHKSYVPPKQYKQIYAPKTYQNTQRYINQRNAYQKKIKTRLEKDRLAQKRITKKNQAKIIRDARRDFKRQQNIGLTGKNVKIPVKNYRPYRYAPTGSQNSNKKQFINSLRNRTALALTKPRISKGQQKLIRGKIDRLLKNATKSVIKDSRTKKIFGSRDGHLPDTSQNRKLLQDIANDPKTTLGPDKHGNVWSSKNLENGTQVWTQTRKGEIINGGVNQTPRVYNPETGLSSPTKPNWK